MFRCHNTGVKGPMAAKATINMFQTCGEPLRPQDYEMKTACGIGKMFSSPRSLQEFTPQKKKTIAEVFTRFTGKIGKVNLQNCTRSKSRCRWKPSLCQFWKQSFFTGPGTSPAVTSHCLTVNSQFWEIVLKHVLHRHKLSVSLFRMLP